MAIKSKNARAVNTPGSLVLQWLTYAFWGWTVLALTWLTAISVGFFLDKSDSASESTVIAYSLAAVVVLFLISLICDIFYTRREPLYKQGAATVIMIIHAVLFALFAIGALIVAVFAVVRLLIGEGTTSYQTGDAGSLTTLTTGLVIAVVYGATLLRTLRPFKLKRSSLVYWIFMTLVIGGIIGLGVAGPAWNARQTRDDRVIERGLMGVSEAVRSYTAKSEKLPQSLAEVKDQTKGDARTLLDRQLVEYMPGDKLPSDPAPANPDKPIPMVASVDAYSYTLCVTYKGSKGTQPYYGKDGSYRVLDPDTYYHEAGRVCYDLQTQYTNYY